MTSTCMYVYIYILSSSINLATLVKGLIPGYKFHIFAYSCGFWFDISDTEHHWFSHITKSDIPFLNIGACEPDLRRDL